jgi:hypothetical protein
MLLAVRTCHGKHLLNQLDIIDDVTLYVSCCLYVCRVMESVSGSLHNKSIVSLVQAEAFVLSCKLFPQYGDAGCKLRYLCWLVLYTVW